MLLTPRARALLRPRTVLIAVLLPAALATAGCTADSGSGAGATTTATTAAGGTTTTAAGGTGTTGTTAATVDPSKNGAAGAGVDPSNPGTPLATTTVPLPTAQDPDATLRVDILGLRRQDRLLLLTAAVTPTTTSSDARTLFAMLGQHTWTPKLVDTVNLKEYSAARAKSSSYLQTDDLGVSAVSGQPAYVYAAFAAPPADVTKMTVSFQSSVPPFPDVPLQ